MKKQIHIQKIIIIKTKIQDEDIDFTKCSLNFLNGILTP